MSHERIHLNGRKVSGFGGLENKIPKLDRV